LHTRILILTHNYIRFPGDFAGVFLHQLSKNLVSAGLKISVLAPHQKGIPVHQNLDGIQVYRFRYAPERYERIAYAGNMHELVMKNPVNLVVFFFFLLTFAWNAYKLAKSEKADIILCQWWIPGGLIGFLTSILQKKPLVLTLHGTDIRLLLKSKLFQRLAYPVFNRAKNITTVSSFLKGKLLSVLSLPQEKVRVVPMPVNPVFESSKPVIGIKGKKKKILSVARYTEQKGVRYLLDALNQLKEKGYDFEAEIVGEGPLEEEFKKKIEQSSLSGSVFLMPMMPQEKLKILYDECDIFVLPSMEEGFGMVLVEAQLCRKPVVGVKSGGILDIIEHEKTGLFALPKDSSSLASAIERLLTNEKYSEELANAGYKSAQEKFSSETITRKYMEILTMSLRGGHLTDEAICTK
jgi:glycosyltransferase involved in cell wall biosynthesis